MLFIDRLARRGPGFIFHRINIYSTRLVVCLSLPYIPCLTCLQTLRLCGGPALAQRVFFHLGVDSLYCDFRPSLHSASRVTPLLTYLFGNCSPFKFNNAPRPTNLHIDKPSPSTVPEANGELVEFPNIWSRIEFRLCRRITRSKYLAQYKESIYLKASNPLSGV